MAEHLALSAVEPCACCGEETAVGSAFFSDRESIPRPGDSDVFLCGLCAAQIRASHNRQRLTADDVASFTKNASAAFITWTSRW